MAPGNTTHDFIAAVAKGDDAEAKKHSSMSDADYNTAKATIQASMLTQGDFVDFTFSSTVDEGGNGHVEGTAQFKRGVLRVRAELSNGPEGWRVTSIQLLP
jgi:hypothetical protein